MRSLSLESNLVNKNMKLLILLITLLVQTNPSLSMPTPGLKLIFSEILGSLEELQEELNQHDLKAFNHTVQIQIPHDIENACECEAAFVQHLKAALKSVKELLCMDKPEEFVELIQNILDNLNNNHLHKVKKSNDSCTFTKHPIRHPTALSNVLIRNIEFIQNWNSHCQPKRN